MVSGIGKRGKSHTQEEAKKELLLIKKLTASLS